MFVHRFEKGTSADTLLLLHGTGGDENDLLELGRELAPHANLLSPRGQVLENGMPRFFRRIRPGVFDLEDLKLRTTELAAFIRDAASKYDLNPARVTALGYSNGANISASLLYREPGVLAGAALLRPMNPWPGAAASQLDGVRVLLSAGRYDSMSSAEDVAGLRETLEKAGASVEEHWHPGGHELGNDDFVAVRRWLAIT